LGQPSAKLYLVRHGRTDWNAMRILQGGIERDLDDEGRRQAEQAAKRFYEIPFQAIYSSVMARARQTAEIIAKSKDLEVRLLEGIHEGSYGCYEGTSIPDFERKFAEKFIERSKLSFEEQMRFRLGDGIDSSQDIVDRVLPLLHDLSKKHLQESILIVTHGWVIRTLVTFLKKEALDGFRVRNGGHILLEGDGEVLQVVDYEEAIL
jgi:broad specificity phosphatase PhoE